MITTFVRSGLTSALRLKGGISGPLVFLGITCLVEGSFWWNASANGNVGEYSRIQLLGYSLAALAGSQIVAVSGRSDSLADSIEEGKIDCYLLRPFGFLATLLPYQAGMIMGRMAILGLFLVASALMAGTSALDVAARVLSASFLFLLGGTLNFLINSTLSSLTFWFKESYAFVSFKETLFWVMSGALIPLDLFPEAFSKALKFFPPGYIVFFPCQVLLGRESLWTLLPASLAWVAFSSLVFAMLWKTGLSRYQAYGG
jgi:ABC-2 type transport system permease protein